MPVLRWSQAAWRKIEAFRDKTMYGIGTDEPWYMEGASGELGPHAISVHWRKPLRVHEINQLAPTADVQERRGRA